jgi:hypothetical protein
VITNMVKDNISWKSKWRIDKFKDTDGEVAKMLCNGASIEEVKKAYPERYKDTDEWKGNLGLIEGRQELIDIICGLGTPTLWDAANAYLGVGDDDFEPAEAQTGLHSVTHTSWMPMDETYPKRTAQTAKWRATWGGSDGNYSWQEYTVVNAEDDTGKNLNRCIADKGTKSEGETWTLELQITFNAT